MKDKTVNQRRIIMAEIIAIEEIKKGENLQSLLTDCEELGHYCGCQGILNAMRLKNEELDFRLLKLNLSLRER